MRTFYFLMLLWASAMTTVAWGQTEGQKTSVLLSATVQKNPAQIKLSWQHVNGSPSGTKYTIRRKAKDDADWVFIAQVLAPAEEWMDNTVQPGIGYEYEVRRQAVGPLAVGYIYSGIELPPVAYRGKILLVYDTVSTGTLHVEINRWINDVEGDGWEVIKIPVNQTEAVTAVKSRILAVYNNDPANVKSVFLLGRVPIPYSGNFAPDGHTPDHLGAWPADGYYAELTGNWTDNTVNSTSASDTRNRNVPGDGKFDQNLFPTNAELQIGRVDMRNLPAFSLSETQLLKKYLDKNHAYRVGQFSVVDSALIDDNFTSHIYGYSASGWISFAALCGASKIVTTDYFTTLKSASAPYRWSYGCGAGSYTNCSGIGTTSDFANDSLRSIFTMLFGSYFGDWDNPSNNLLRAAIANGSTLVNCWSGRPRWHFHHMALGEPIGYSVLRTAMMYPSIYYAGQSQGGIHVALMGDPTLRASVIQPVTSVTATYVNGKAQLSWSGGPALSTINGFDIYRKSSVSPQWVKVNTQFIKAYTYTVPLCTADSGAVYTYRVHAVKLETNNSGSYYNMSIGKSDTMYNPKSHATVASFSTSKPNPLKDNVVAVYNTTINGGETYWDYGDGSEVVAGQHPPVHTYANAGTYTITLFTFSPYGCGFDMVSKQVTIDVVASFETTINGNLVTVNNTSQNATEYYWNFGDGSNIVTGQHPPAHTYANPGTYTIALYALSSNGSVDMAIQQVNISTIGAPQNKSGLSDKSEPGDTSLLSTGINTVSLNSTVNIYPNPTRDGITVDAPFPAVITMIGLDGREVLSRKGGGYISLTHIPEGVYVVVVSDASGEVKISQKLVIAGK